MKDRKVFAVSDKKIHDLERLLHLMVTNARGQPPPLCNWIHTLYVRYIVTSLLQVETTMPPSSSFMLYYCPMSPFLPFIQMLGHMYKPFMIVLTYVCGHIAKYCIHCQHRYVSLGLPFSFEWKTWFWGKKCLTKIIRKGIFFQKSKNIF